MAVSLLRLHMVLECTPDQAHSSGPQKVEHHPVELRLRGFVVLLGCEAILIKNVWLVAKGIC